MEENEKILELINEANSLIENKEFEEIETTSKDLNSKIDMIYNQWIDNGKDRVIVLKEEEKKSRPQKGPQKKFIIIDQLDVIRHETLGTSLEGTVHSLENKM